jgi:hypothetical protein
MRSRKKWTIGSVGLIASLAAVGVVAALTAGGAGAGSSVGFAVPRSDTLYTSGK